MSYSRILPQIFPHRIVGAREDISRYVVLLMNPDRTDVPYGSSFAVTADQGKGQQALWLSECSLKYLEERLGE